MSNCSPHHLSEYMPPRICLGEPPTGLDPHFRSWAGRPLLRNPLVSLSPEDWYGNIDPFSITYASRPRLRVRLTLSGLTLLRKPWVFGERVSHPFSRYSFRHNHFCFVHPTLSVELHPTTERSPTTHDTRGHRASAASVVNFSPGHYRRRIT